MGMRKAAVFPEPIGRQKCVWQWYSQSLTGLSNRHDVVAAENSGNAVGLDRRGSLVLAEFDVLEQGRVQTSLCKLNQRLLV